MVWNPAEVYKINATLSYLTTSYTILINSHINARNLQCTLVMAFFGSWISGYVGFRGLDTGYAWICGLDIQGRNFKYRGARSLHSPSNLVPSFECVNLHLLSGTCTVEDVIYALLI